ncbi:MAG: hypothetical protein NTY86_21075 [Deltaproteobacteria bacterium]|nr:hypothetical protein [Deltaproteobacteria bacterium]
MEVSISSGEGSIRFRIKSRSIPTGREGGWKTCAWLRQNSMIVPTRTPDGQAVEHALQSRQKKDSSRTAGVNSSFPSATARARAARPRGLDLSRFVSA